MRARNVAWRSVWFGLACVLLLWAACDPVKVPSEGATSEKIPDTAAAIEPQAEPDSATKPEAKAEPSVDAGPDNKSEPLPEAGSDATPETMADNQPTDKPYTITIFDREVVHSTGKINLRNIFNKFKFRNKTFAKLALFVELESPCYPFEKWATPPAGHNWPANCDAYDRNMDVTWNHPKNDGDPPGYDLIRIITPFGGPLKAAVNITDLGNAMAQQGDFDREHEMRVHISTYSDGAGKVSGSKGTWIVSVRLEVTPGTPPRNVLAAIPLFNHSYKHNDNKIESVEFTLPPGTKSSQLFYTATGHGGGTADRACIGHADEFCKRTHRLEADGKQFFQWIPWRDDCAKWCTETKHPRNPNITYCLENPCGSKASVRAPRANWCPGTVTYPLSQKPAAFQTPGKHTFGYRVASVANGGSWRVSAVLYAFGE